MTKLLLIALGFGLNRIVDNSDLRTKVIAKAYEVVDVVKQGVKDGIALAKSEIAKAKEAADKNK